MRKRILLLIGISLFILSYTINYNFDFTQDKRFSLDKESVSMIKNIKDNITIDVFLSGKIPPKFRKLNMEIKQKLNLYYNLNNNLHSNFINPFEGDDSIDKILSEMSSYGMKPFYNIDVKNQNIEQNIIFPWIIMNNGKSSVLIPIMDSQYNKSDESSIISSINKLDSKLIDGLKRLENNSKSKIAIISSHETSSSLKISDFVSSLQLYYEVFIFDIKKYKSNPFETFEYLKTFPLIIISNPKKRFENEEKFILDQYQMNGGSILWMLNSTTFDEDKFKLNGKSEVISNQLNLDDYFFNQGIKIKTQLVLDNYCGPIIIANGDGNKTQYIPVPWVYSPMVKPNKSIINNNLEYLLLKYSNPIDTVKNNLKKLTLINSSNFNKIQNIPSQIDIQTAIKGNNKVKFSTDVKLMSVLIEGEFNSLYRNKIKPIVNIFKLNKGKSKSIIITDGQFGENQIENGNPLELGYDKWTNNFYSNKEFLINSVHYLTGNKNLIKEIPRNNKFILFDKLKINKRDKRLVILILIFPVLILFMLYSFINKYRKNHR